MSAPCKKWSKREDNELINYFIKKCEKVRYRVNINDLCRKYKKTHRTKRTCGGLANRVATFREKIYKRADMEMKTKVKMMFALRAPVKENFLRKLRKNAYVKLNDTDQIIKYKEKRAGGLRLSAFNNSRDPESTQKRTRDMLKFLADMTDSLEEPISNASFMREFRESTGSSEPDGSLSYCYGKVRERIFESSEYDIKTRIRMMFISSTKVEECVLNQLRKKATVKLDRSGKIRIYKAFDRSLELVRTRSSRRTSGVKREEIKEESEESDEDEESDDEKIDNGSVESESLGDLDEEESEEESTDNEVDSEVDDEEEEDSDNSQVSEKCIKRGRGLKVVVSDDSEESDVGEKDAGSSDDSDDSEKDVKDQEKARIVRKLSESDDSEVEDKHDVDSDEPDTTQNAPPLPRNIPESESEDDSKTNEKITKRRRKRNSRPRSHNFVGSYNENTDMDSEEEEEPPRKSKVRGLKRISRGRETSEDESDEEKETDDHEDLRNEEDREWRDKEVPVGNYEEIVENHRENRSPDVSHQESSKNGFTEAIENSEKPKEQQLADKEFAENPTKGQERNDDPQNPNPQNQMSLVIEDDEFPRVDAKSIKSRYHSVPPGLLFIRKRAVTKRVDEQQQIPERALMASQMDKSQNQNTNESDTAGIEIPNAAFEPRSVDPKDPVPPAQIQNSPSVTDTEDTATGSVPTIDEVKEPLEESVRSHEKNLNSLNNQNQIEKISNESEDATVEKDGESLQAAKNLAQQKIQSDETTSILPSQTQTVTPISSVNGNGSQTVDTVTEVAAKTMSMIGEKRQFPEEEIEEPAKRMKQENFDTSCNVSLSVENQTPNTSLNNPIEEISSKKVLEWMAAFIRSLNSNILLDLLREVENAIQGLSDRKIPTTNIILLLDAGLLLIRSSAKATSSSEVTEGFTNLKEFLKKLSITIYFLNSAEFEKFQKKIDEMAAAIDGENMIVPIRKIRSALHQVFEFLDS